MNTTPPTTAREALDLAWELAHPVKEGQTIPAGTTYFARYSDGTIGIHTTLVDRNGPLNYLPRRTLDPLPEPEPDWIDAPAVLATCLGCNEDGLASMVHVRFVEDRWVCTECMQVSKWSKLKDVTPLYPKENHSESLHRPR